MNGLFAHRVCVSGLYTNNARKPSLVALTRRRKR